ncbi:MAG: small subunit ribosomal protein [Solirubrobacteraceae bacterium]|jgi:small subunit ribosomal protein S6|nr:small subunit ribosomal protein [Solirubrobacteraceae bacterium]
MAQPAPIYDLTLLLNADADEERRTKIIVDVETLIDKHGGSLVGRHDWGVRQTAFEVRKTENSDYHLIQFYATNEVLNALDHALKIADGVNRFRIIKLRHGTPEPPDLRAAAAGAMAGEASDEESSAGSRR